MKGIRKVLIDQIVRISLYLFCTAIECFQKQFVFEKYYSHWDCLFTNIVNKKRFSCVIDI